MIASDLRTAIIVLLLHICTTAYSFHTASFYRSALAPITQARPSNAWTVGRGPGTTAVQCTDSIRLATASHASAKTGSAASAEETAKKFLLYNTATKSKGPLRLNEGADRDGVPAVTAATKKRPLKFYSCGPTVYDSAHIGNFRAFLTYDVLKRWLLYLGFEVDHVCNLTDVDDKIIKRMQRDNVSLKQLTDQYANTFFDDLRSLNIIPAGRYPRATEHIEDIVEMVVGLMDKGLAYEKNGSVYFRVNKLDGYGKLSGIKFDKDEAAGADGNGEGGDVGDDVSGDVISDDDEYDVLEGDKECAKDFALWKAYKEEDGQVFWETSLGKGRPGWHIECSAMARRYLGDCIDLHAGGVDLVFPHHENEIAQTEGFTGKQFCSCWVHNGFVNVDSEKMSKSKGNFLTLQSALSTALDVRAFRYLVVSSQYRMALNFTPQALQGAKNTVKRLDKFKAMLESCTAGGNGQPLGGGGGGGSVEDNAKLTSSVTQAMSQFESGMNDDLNTPRAAAGLFNLVKLGEEAFKKGRLDPTAADLLLASLSRIDDVFGVFYDVVQGGGGDGSSGKKGFSEEASLEEVVELSTLSAEMLTLLEKRASARSSKNWPLADEARDEIASLGYKVKDVKGGGVEVYRT